MISYKKSDREQIFTDFALDLTPLLDVVFILIFFLILSVNSVSYSINVDLPSDKENVASRVQDQDVVTVKILADNIWYINKNKYADFASFKQAFLSLPLDKRDSVAIMSEKNVMVESFLELVSFLKKHNIKTADILLDKSPAGN